MPALQCGHAGPAEPVRLGFGWGFNMSQSLGTTSPYVLASEPELPVSGVEYQTGPEPLEPTVAPQDL